MAYKYDLLKQHLLAEDRGQLSTSFSEIEKILGLLLPASARNHDAWWLDASARITHVQAKVWLDAHPRVERVDRNAQVVFFGAVSS